MDAMFICLRTALYLYSQCPFWSEYGNQTQSVTDNNDQYDCQYHIDIYEALKRTAIIYPSVLRRWGRSSGDITK